MPARLLLLPLALLTGCAGAGGTGSGVVVTESRPLTLCTGVRVGGQADVVVTRGDTPALTVTWDDDLLADVVTEVRGGVLEVSQRGWGQSSRNRLRVAVTLPSLTTVTAGGQATVTADIGDVPAFTAGAGGQSAVTVRGAADAQTLSASGQARLDAGGLAGESAAVTASGQSRVTVGATGRATGSAGGQSTVEATAAEVRVGTSGQAAVRGR